MSTKLAPNKITDSDKTVISNKNVCRHYKVGYCKFATTCKHKHIEKECEDKDCNKKCLNRHIKACRYGSRCKRFSDCEFKHNEKDKHSEMHKVDEQSNTKKDLFQAKCELEGLKIEISTLKLAIEEQKQLLNNVNLNTETFTTENKSLKKEINLLKVQLREQQEYILKSKIESLKTNEEIQKIQEEFNVIKNSQIAEKGDNNQEYNKVAEGVNPLDSQTNSLVNRPDNTSTKTNMATLTKDFKTVSTIEFFEVMLDMWNKRDNIESPQCVKCGEQFQEQKSFF